MKRVSYRGYGLMWYYLLLDILPENELKISSYNIIYCTTDINVFSSRFQLYWTVRRTLLSMEKSLSHWTRAPVPKLRDVRRHASVTSLAARILVPVSAGIYRVPVRDSHIERV